MIIPGEKLSIYDEKGYWWLLVCESSVEDVWDVDGMIVSKGMRAIFRKDLRGIRGWRDKK